MFPRKAEICKYIQLKSKKSRILTSLHNNNVLYTIQGMNIRSYIQHEKHFNHSKWTSYSTNNQQYPSPPHARDELLYSYNIGIIIIVINDAEKIQIVLNE